MTEIPAGEHEHILNNPEADRRLAQRAIERAVEEDGMSLEEATRLYGLPEEPRQLSIKEMNQLIRDALDAKASPSIDHPEAKRIYPSIVEDVKRAEKEGLTVAMVNDIEDIFDFKP